MSFRFVVKQNNYINTKGYEACYIKELRQKTCSLVLERHVLRATVNSVYRCSSKDQSWT